MRSLVALDLPTSPSLVLMAAPWDLLIRDPWKWRPEVPPQNIPQLTQSLRAKDINKMKLEDPTTCPTPPSPVTWL